MSSLIDMLHKLGPDLSIALAMSPVVLVAIVEAFTCRGQRRAHL